MSIVEHLEIEKDVRQKIKISHNPSTQRYPLLLFWAKFSGLLKNQLSYMSMRILAHTDTSYIIGIIIIYTILYSDSLYFIYHIFLMLINTLWQCDLNGCIKFY